MSLDTKPPVLPDVCQTQEEAPPVEAGKTRGDANPSASEQIAASNNNATSENTATTALVIGISAACSFASAILSFVVGWRFIRGKKGRGECEDQKGSST